MAGPAILRPFACANLPATSTTTAVMTLAKYAFLVSESYSTGLVKLDLQHDQTGIPLSRGKLCTWSASCIDCFK